MLHLTSRFAGVLLLAAPLAAGACGMSQPNSRTLIFEPSSAGCKMSDTDMARYREQLAKALAALPAAPAAGSAVRARHGRAGTSAVRQSLRGATRTHEKVPSVKIR